MIREAGRGIYRDEAVGARLQVRRLRLQRQRELAALPPVLRVIYARRVSRAVAGAAAATGGLALLGFGVIRALAVGAQGADGQLTLLLGSCWVAAVLLYVGAGAWAKVSFDRALAAELRVQGEVFQCLQQLRAVNLRGRALAMINGAASPSVTLWLSGLCILLPLSLHYAAVSLFTLQVAPHHGFDVYIVLSACIVGHCHLVLFYCAICDGRALVTGAIGLEESARLGWGTYGWVVLSSLVPGLGFIGIPVLLVAITGLYLPFAYGWTGHRIGQERRLLAELA